MSDQQRYDPLVTSIIHTLCYFDLFDYPLKRDEIFSFMQRNHITRKEVEVQLAELTVDGSVFSFDGFYSLRNNVALVDRRKKGNTEALKWLPLAEKQAILIQSFPFVRAVMASGSLSKGYMDENCDLDFFIITEHKRLWIARMLLVIYKRLFLKGSHKYFCVNYFVDNHNLTIEERNIFTATELSTLIPLTGNGYFKKLIESNLWVSDLLPNYEMNKHERLSVHESRFKMFLERILNFFAPDFWNGLFMWMTLRRWQGLYERKYSKAEFDIAFKTRPDVSKNHPNHFQKRVLNQYQKRKEEFYALEG